MERLIFDSRNGVYNLLYTIELAINQYGFVVNENYGIDSDNLCELCEKAENHINNKLRDEGLLFGSNEHGDYYIANLDSENMELII